MAGETDEIALEDAMGIASFQVATGRSATCQLMGRGPDSSPAAGFHGGIFLNAVIIAWQGGRCETIMEMASG